MALSFNDDLRRLLHDESVGAADLELRARVEPKFDVAVERQALVHNRHALLILRQLLLAQHIRLLIVIRHELVILRIAGILARFFLVSITASIVRLWFDGVLKFWRLKLALRVVSAVLTLVDPFGELAEIDFVEIVVFLWVDVRVLGRVARLAVLVLRVRVIVLFQVIVLTALVFELHLFEVLVALAMQDPQHELLLDGRFGLPAFETRDEASFVLGVFAQVVNILRAHGTGVGLRPSKFKQIVPLQSQ